MVTIKTCMVFGDIYGRTNAVVKSFHDTTLPGCLKQAREFVEEKEDTCGWMLLGDIRIDSVEMEAHDGANHLRSDA